jgi:hypothetical protein
MGEDAPSTNHGACDFRYQHAEKSRLADVETQVCFSPSRASARMRLLVRWESFRSGSARLGRSQKDGLPSRCRGMAWHLRAQGHQLALGGSLVAAPSKSRAEMDSKTHRLVLLAALSLCCVMLALAVDHTVFGSVFSALRAVAVIGAVGPRPRR